MILLSAADLVMPGQVLGPGSVVIDGDRIVEVRHGDLPASPGDLHFDLRGHYVVPGFVDVHVHGVNGLDSLDGPNAIGDIASELPRYGVTAFCPTSVACSPSTLARFLSAVGQARVAPAEHTARVLPAHLESNFLNPDYRGAQPVECLRLPPGPKGARTGGDIGAHRPAAEDPHAGYTGDDVLEQMTAGQADIGIVTLAPELPGSLGLIRVLRDRGHLVSLGHSGATYEQAQEALAAGATQATHLFNRMPRIGHRSPGLAGAMLENEDVAAELVCDGYHVHPAMMRVAIAAKGPAKVMAITDGTAGSGLPAGARVALGGQAIIVGENASFLEDGTLAGSVLTMDKAFRVLVGRVGLSLPDAVAVCATTPARELHLEGCGVLAEGAFADLAVLDGTLRVVQTWVRGQIAYSALGAAG